MQIDLKKSKKTHPKRFTSFSLFVWLFISLLVGIYLGWKNFPGFLKAKVLFFTHSEFFPSIGESNNLKTISLNISFNDLKKIQQKRAEAVHHGRLIASNDDYVNASITDLNYAKSCEVRLKGDLPDHWSTSKWSLRVKMKKNHLVSGMSRFSLQNPVTRNNTYEWLFLETLRKEGLMSVRYDFVNLLINGKKMGIYAIEEYISKEFIENNNRREGVVISLDEELMWTKHEQDSSNIEWNSIYRNSVVSPLNEKRIDKNPLLARQKTTAINLLRDLQSENIKAEDLFDCEKLGRFLAICRLWPGELCLEWDDMNFYFNPILGKFEPIGYDGTCLSENIAANENSKYCFFTGGKVTNSWVNYALSSPRIAESYTRYLRIFSSESYLKEIKDEFHQYEQKIRRLLTKELISGSKNDFWQNFASLFNNDPWSILEKRAFIIRQELNHQLPVLSFARFRNGSTDYDIHLRNSLTQPVEFIGIKSGNNELNASQIIRLCPQLRHLYFWPKKSIVLPSQTNDPNKNYGSIEFAINKKDLELKQNLSENEVSIQFRLLGCDEIISQPLTIDDHPYDPNALPFQNKILLLNSEMYTIKEDTIYFHPGNHVIKEDIFIPHGMKLVIGKSTNLLFERNASLVSEGSIRAIGTPKHPITISSSKDFWDGILLFDAKDKSFFENVIFSNVGGTGQVVNPYGIEKDGWIMTGGVNVLDTEAHFKNCVFKNCFTEDALNIYSSFFSLENCKFENCSSDGFDGDFVNGTVRNCQFINIAGDGVDFSGSSVSIEKSIFYNIEDKAISVGEASNVKISDSNVNIANFGVVAKDRSNAHCINTLIKNTRIAGVSCYHKKTSFGPGNAVLTNVRFEDLNKTFLIQSGSSATADGISIKSEEFLTSSLY
jgi:hypothetical protein